VFARIMDVQAGLQRDKLNVASILTKKALNVKLRALWKEKLKVLSMQYSVDPS
jgi:hypothetical protein